MGDEKGKGSFFSGVRKFLFVDEAVQKSQYETPEHILSELELYSALSFQYILILGAAACIGAFGLMANSGVIIVGAMIIAPLMKPIISFSYGITIHDMQIKVRAAITLAIGVVLTIGISYLLENLLDLRVVTEEMADRIRPNLIDLGVAIAAGIAAAVAVTRQEVADALPGVAIAVALVPPLCVSGISLSMGVTEAFLGSLLLFGINLLAIILSAVFVFLVSGYGSFRFSATPIVVSLMILYVMGWPLSESLKQLRLDDDAQNIVETFLVNNYPDVVDIHPADLKSIGLTDYKDHLFLYIEVAAPQDALTDEQLDYIHSQLEKHYGRPVNLKIQFLLTQELFRYSYLNDDGSHPLYGVDDIIPRK